MFIPNSIKIHPKLKKELEKKGLYKQFLKSKNNILLWIVSNWTKLKLREPKKDEIRYFRINSQYRCLCKIDNDNTLLVLSLDNHQN